MNKHRLYFILSIVSAGGGCIMGYLTYLKPMIIFFVVYVIFVTLMIWDSPLRKYLQEHEPNLTRLEVIIKLLF
jgi:hypothetical protein